MISKFQRFLKLLKEKVVSFILNHPVELKYRRMLFSDVTIFSLPASQPCVCIEALVRLLGK